MLRIDHDRLTRRVRGLERAHRQGRSITQALDDVERALAKARRTARQRMSVSPELRWPPELPIVEARHAIADAMRDHPVIVVCGETGSGKTTQLPKIALDIGRGVAGRIGHTQPRRIAARGVARRIQQELGEHGASLVGWQVRFDDRTRDTTRIKLMTDGILLAETRGDPDLLQYDTIILDEAHERSLTIDFLLGYLHQLLPRRPELRVVITSATIDPERFSRHFDDAPIIEVSGRVYPVAMRYRPRDRDGAEDVEPLDDAVEGAIRELMSEGPGDILVFLATTREIQDLARRLRERDLGEVEILPLFARLPNADQDLIFKPSARRRIVLSTNVAETSLTVPGIRFVIDAGTARVGRYSERLRVQRLPVEPISQASARQRAGRCGRVADGIAIRLYSERDHDRRAAFTAPELQRTNLAGVILQMKMLGLGDIDAFPFVDPPRARYVREGYLTLFELGAVDDEGRLTEIGDALGRLPIDPRLGRMLLEAARSGCLDAMRTIVAALSVSDPRVRPHDAKQDADQAHARFAHPASDFLSFVRLHDAWRTQRSERSKRGLRTWSRHHHLRFSRMHEWDDLIHQLRDLDRALLPKQSNAGTPARSDKRDSDTVHRALLPGLITHVAMRGRGHAYRGTQDTTMHLWPGSALFNTKPKWIVCAERIETSRLYARIVAPIQRAWIEPLAAHMVQRRYADAHWHQPKSRVDAFETVTLQGLEIVRRRRVAYGPIHPIRAREIFIRHALVAGQYRSKAAFHRHNAGIRADARSWAARLRMRDVELDRDDLFAFFDMRIPRDVTDGSSFERWRRHAEAEDASVLRLNLDDLVPELAGRRHTSEYPDTWHADGVRFALHYRLAPEQDDDGISVHVPHHQLDTLRQDRLDWLVPGWLPLRIEAMLRTLPKARRRELMPIPERADALARELSFGEGSLTMAVVHALGSTIHPRLRASEFDRAALPPHLSLRVVVLDDNDRPLASGRNLDALRRRVGKARAQAIDAAQVVRATTWAFGALEPRTTVRHGGFATVATPALVDRGDHVELRPIDDAHRASAAHRRGVRRLLLLAAGDRVRRAIESRKDWRTLEKRHRTRGSDRQLLREMAARVVDRAAGLHTDVPRDEASFERASRDLSRNLSEALSDTFALAHAIFERYADLAKKLMLHPPPGWAAPIDAMIEQLACLIPDGFMIETPDDRLRRMPRYLDGIDVRLQRLGFGELAKDREREARVSPHWRRVRELSASIDRDSERGAQLDAIRWMLEDMRLAVFAQELAGKGAFSPRDLEDAWDHWDAMA